MTQAELLLDPTGEKKRTSLKKGATGKAIKRFFAGRLYGHREAPDLKLDEFHSSDLLRFVLGRVNAVDGTTTRILRILREDGKLDYDVTNRHKALYRILGVVVDGEILGRIRSDAIGGAE